ncbi:GDSL-type esterase/lipase family protein [Phenylobacterium sp.]|uniref:GDSL-type esterase/lipase family protein n=1 Tax=Phenylobacterium sp. TaxID=1871053 RepID=UPI0025FA751D|nr:GDSL-type esterase/lipase family protein [Phenylobacterium sp.]
MAAAGPALARPSRAARPKVVTMLGDSITAGLGLPAAAALPNQLHLALARLGVPNVVRAAGVSGDTTRGGLARVDFSVQTDTDLAIVALGGNDLLQGQDTAGTRANLDAIVRKLQARHIRVLIAGIAAPQAVGGAYARDFNAAFERVAKTHSVPLYPDLIDGVGRRADLKQPDGIHPNAQGVMVIAARLAPIVAKALTAGR